MDLITEPHQSSSDAEMACGINGFIPAAVRVIESHSPEEVRLFYDSYARRLPGLFLFILEAVTRYLHPKAVAETLRYIGQTARGDRLVFTYLLRRVVEGNSHHSWC